LKIGKQENIENKFLELRNIKNKKTLKIGNIENRKTRKH